MSLFQKTTTHNHTLQVTSLGGTGTTMLYRFLEDYDADVPKDTHDWIPWKHQRTPPADSKVSRGFRALYLFGNPMNAVLSVFRRGYQHWHVERMDGDVDAWDKSWDLEEFLAQGHDHFRMERHFLNWTQADRSYPILLLNFDALWERLPEVFAFLGLPSSAMGEFPERRERHSDWLSQPTQIRRDLKDMYGSLQERIECTSDFRII